MTIPRLDGLSKNYLINGGMDYNQRRGVNGTGLTDGGLLYNAHDRWRSDRSGDWSGNPTLIRQSVTVPGQPKLRESMQLSGQSSSGGTAIIIFDQLIESIFAQELSGKPISLGFHYNESEFQQVEVAFFSADAKDNFSPNTQIGSTVTLDITPDSTWRKAVLENVVMPSDVERGLRVRFILKNPENTGVNITTQLTGFKINIGPTAQDFSYHGYDLLHELDYCQRYFEKSYNLDVEPQTDTQVGMSWFRRETNANENGLHTSYRVTKRNNGIINIYDKAGTNGQVNRDPDSYSTSVAVFTEDQSERGINVRAQTGSNSGIAYHWKVDSEL